MRAEPRVERPRLGFAFAQQDLEHLGDAGGVDAGPHHVRHALGVSLVLVLPREVREGRIGAEPDGGVAQFVIADVGEHADRGEPDVRPLRLLHLADGVAHGDVPDLVAEHPGHLGQVLGAFDEAAIDVDEATGDGEGVDVLAVDDEELPVEIA